MQTIDFYGIKYTITKCTKEDVPIHFKLVEKGVVEDYKNAYLYGMYSAVEKGVAYKIGNVAFLYYTTSKVDNSPTLDTWGIDPKALLVLMYYIFTEVDTDTKSFTITPQNKASAMGYRSLCTKQSIRAYHDGNPNLHVNVHNLRLMLEGIMYV